MNLPELSRDERAALACLIRKAVKFGPENCWPKIYSIGLSIGKKPRTVSRIMTALTAFGIIERIGRGRAANKYNILLNSEQLTEIIGVAYQKDVVAFGVAKENATKVKQIRLVKAKTRHAIGVATPSLCPPTPQRSPMSDMPTMYVADPIAQKLWRMAQRWIAINDPDLSSEDGDKARPIMYALEAAGAIHLPEDGPLPMITWPALEAAPLIKTVPAVNSDAPRKPMGIAQSDLDTLRRKIEGKI